MIRDHVIVDSITVKHKKFVFNENKEVTKGKKGAQRLECFDSIAWNRYYSIENIFVSVLVAPLVLG